MRLDQLSSGIAGRIVGGDGSEEITDIAFDSARVKPGTLFVCVRGMSADGHDYAPAALDAGARALVTDHELDLEVPQIVVADSRRAMGPLAARLFGDPTRELITVGVTGTNGKTTTTFLLRAILEASGLPCGLLGTIKQIVG
ncbi:MAG: Mur ligase domain-containing protein, partial [Solirubrobacterales bacterium]